MHQYVYTIQCIVYIHMFVWLASDIDYICACAYNTYSTKWKKKHEYTQKRTYQVVNQQIVYMSYFDHIENE